VKAAGCLEITSLTKLEEETLNEELNQRHEEEQVYLMADENALELEEPGAEVENFDPDSQLVEISVSALFIPDLMYRACPSWTYCPISGPNLRKMYFCTDDSTVFKHQNI